MTSSRRSLRFLALLVVLLLIVTACVRPFSQSDEEAAQATAEAEVTAQADEEGQAAEPADEDSDSADTDSADADSADEQEEVDEHVDEVDSDSDADLEETEEDADEVAAESEESSSETADEDAGSAEADSSEEAADGETSDEDAAAEDAATDQDSSMDVDAGAAPESDAGETTTTTEPTPLPAVHVVSKGENLFRIGLRYGLSWVPLAYYNNIPNPDLIYVGQNIHIPGGQAPPAQSKPESSMYTNYVVKRGDTLFRISLAFGVSPEEIVEANGIVNPNRIYAGQVLKIPTGTP